MASTSYQETLGQRLRSIRLQQGLTLQDVEERTGGRWKAVVVGSYERGDRAISIGKLAELARFYGVPLADVLPAPATAGQSEADEPELVLDLTTLTETSEDDRYQLLRRYAQRIQLQRGDYNGRVLTLRHDDLQALSVIFDLPPEELFEELARARVLART